MLSSILAEILISHLSLIDQTSMDFGYAIFEIVSFINLMPTIKFNWKRSSKLSISRTSIKDIIWMSYLILCTAWYLYYDMSSMTVFVALSFERVHHWNFQLIIHPIGTIAACDVKRLFNGVNFFRLMIECFIWWFVFFKEACDFIC